MWNVYNGEFMDKNVKIDVETHRRLSIKAAEMQVQKSELCAALIRYALDRFDEKEVRKLIAVIVTSYGNS